VLWRPLIRALWTYLDTPFLYTHDGFQTEEIPSIEADGETWRRLKVIFPSDVRDHCADDAPGVRL